MNILRYSPIAFVLIVADCGGGGGDSMSASPTPIVNAAVGGIYDGSDSTTGQQLQGIVAPDGTFEFIETDGVQYAGKITSAGDNISGTYTGYAPYGSTFADGSTEGNGTLSGTIVPGTSATGTSKFTTSKGNETTSTLSLTFQVAYNSGASLSNITGNWRDQATGVPVTVSANGDVTALNQADGCSLTGSVAVINSADDVYTVEFVYSGCEGTLAQLNGVHFTGLGTLQGTAFLLGVTGGGFAATDTILKQ